jgi:hypothetical protein
MWKKINFCYFLFHIVQAKNISKYLLFEGNDKVNAFLSKLYAIE